MPSNRKKCRKWDKVGHFSGCCRSKQKAFKGAEAVYSMATPNSSDSENDIDLTTLKGLFTLTEKVGSLASSELNNSYIKLQGSDATHTVRSLEILIRKLKIENSSEKFVIDTGSYGGREGSSLLKLFFIKIKV